MRKFLQASTLNALMLGNFDRTVSVAEFLKQSDTGIGTYTGLDGEAIFEDGVAYKAAADGSVVSMTPEDGVAFGTVTSFDSSVPVHRVTEIRSLEALKAALDKRIAANRNVFYMVKLRGEFSTMHVRSCFVCEKPYPTLSEAASHQREFRYENTAGSVIAVYCPDYVEGINLPGWHFHYLSGDKTKGGHILGLSADALDLQINALREFELVLPENTEFAKLNLCEDLSAKTRAVEGNSHS